MFCILTFLCSSTYIPNGLVLWIAQSLWIWCLECIPCSLLPPLLGREELNNRMTILYKGDSLDWPTWSRLGSLTIPVCMPDIPEIAENPVTTTTQSPKLETHQFQSGSEGLSRGCILENQWCSVSSRNAKKPVSKTSGWQWDGHTHQEEVKMGRQHYTSDVLPVQATLGMGHPFWIWVFSLYGPTYCHVS